MEYNKNIVAKVLVYNKLYYLSTSFEQVFSLTSLISLKL